MLAQHGAKPLALQKVLSSIEICRIKSEVPFTMDEHYSGLVTESSRSFLHVCRLCLKGDPSEVWWHVPVIPVLRWLRQEDQMFEASLDYLVKPCFESLWRLHIHIFSTFSMWLLCVYGLLDRWLLHRILYKATVTFFLFFPPSYETVLLTFIYYYLCTFMTSVELRFCLFLTFYFPRAVGLQHGIEPSLTLGLETALSCQW